MTNLLDSLRQLQDRIEITDTDEVAAVICPDCDGLGYIRFDVHYTDERFGKMYPCPNPDCPVRRQQKLEQAAQVMEKRSSWRPDYAEMTFEAFQGLMGKSNRWVGKRGAFAMAYAFAHQGSAFTQSEAAQIAFRTHWPGAKEGASTCVVLRGDVGVGKTGLAVAAANDLMTRGELVIFIRVRDLIAHVQDTYRTEHLWTGERITTDSCLQIYIQVPYLILDEFELENYTNDRLEILEKIIRGRGDRPHMLPTLVTTNLTQDEMYNEERWGRRITDILAKYHWVNVEGVKLRQTMPVASGAW